ncbi:MAG: BamA/TamA family outer membrane protein [Chlorobiaceae bacterium]|nr:BamA/TamA family outer membrane protein [Chlorobiaceae bacterium]
MRPLRKTVGLALSGGGANSIAQIGVLKALEEEGVPVDCIAGTSMGALVGGLYSSGYSATELESIVLALPWQKLVSLDNEAPRTNSYLEQKNIRDRASIAIRFEKFRLIVPKALSAAQTLTRTIDLLVLNAPYHTSHAFADLPVNFRAVATDMVSGRRVTLVSGPLSEAMRASSTIPILYHPIERNGLKLSDGGLVANLPVDELDAAGTDYKIAVDTHGRMYTDSDDIDVPWKAADQAMTILTQVQYPRQLELADLVITPDIGNHKATDFSDIRQLIDAGYAKGRLLAPLIRKGIRFTGRRDIDITGYSKSVEGLPVTTEDPELSKRVKAIVSRQSGVRTILGDLLETGQFRRVHAEIDHQTRKALFVLELLPRIESIVVTGGVTNAVPQAAIDTTFVPVTKRFYTSTEATRSLEKLIHLYRKRGYSFVKIESTKISGTTLTIQLSSGTIDHIAVEQNRKLTRPLPIKREMTLETAKAFRYADAEQTIDNLYGTGVFNRVSLFMENLQPAETAQGNTVTVRLDEKPATVLRLGVRYDETANAQLLIDFRNENFQGSGNSIGGWTKFSQQNNRVNLEYSVPRFGRTPLTMFTRAFFDQHDVETRQLTLSGNSGLLATGEPRSLGIQKYGFTTSFGTRVRKNDRLTADFTLQNAQSYPRNKRAEPIDTGNINMASIGGQFTFDNRDNSFLPSGGRLINVRYSSTTIIQDDHKPFWQLVASFEENLSTGSATTLQLTTLIGTSSIEVPLSEKFFLGGTGNAYSYRFIGLKDNDLIGNNIAVSGALLRYRSPVQLAFPTSFILLYNIGNVWQRRSQMSLGHLVQGIGTGVVWDTPIGPAQFTVAKPFAFERSEIRDSARIDFSETIFYLSLGHHF